MFVGGIIMIFTLASCGGTQKRTVVNYTPREVEQANQVMTYYNTSLALLKNVVVEKDVNAVLGYMEQSGKAPAADNDGCCSTGFLSERFCICCKSGSLFQ